MSSQKYFWDTEDNAEAYDEYASNFPMYKETSHDLVSKALIKSGMTVVDLATGTGATTQAIFNLECDNLKVIAVDQAQEMLNKAKEKFVGKNVTYIVSEAENMASKIYSPVDRVVCNSAFWQIKPKLAFGEIAKILKPSGVFAFNLPDGFLSDARFTRQPKKPSPYTADDLIDWAREAGLELVSESIEDYEKRVEEIMAFSKIPIMKRRFKTDEEMNNYFNKLKNDPNFNSKRQWLYFVFKKIS